MTTALTIPQIAALLATTAPLLQAELNAFPEPVLRFRPAPGEWSVNEVLGHLIEAEARGFAGRIERMLAQEGYRCQAWDPDQVARERRDDQKPTPALLEELAKCRSESLRLVHSLVPAQLMSSAEHPVVGRLSVNDLLHEWVHHDRNHSKQIMSNLQLWIWPHMGNAQRFSG